FIEVRPTRQIKTDQLVTSQRRPAAGPQVNEQTGNDRAIGLDLNPDRIMADQVSASQNMFEKAEKQFDGPAMAVDVGNDFGRRVEEIGGDADNAIGRRAGGAAFAAAGFLMRRGSDLHDPHRMIGALIFMAQANQGVADYASLLGRVAQRTF